MVPPTTLLCWGKIFLFNVEHYQQESLKGFFFTYNFLFLSRHLFKLKSFSLLVTKSVWSCHHYRGPPRHQGLGQGHHDSDHPPQAERGRSRTLEGIITWLSAADGSGPLCESKLIFWVDILTNREFKQEWERRWLLLPVEQRKLLDMSFVFCIIWNV